MGPGRCSPSCAGRPCARLRSAIAAVAPRPVRRPRLRRRRHPRPLVYPRRSSGLRLRPGTSAATAGDLWPITIINKATEEHRPVPPRSLESTFTPGGAFKTLTLFKRVLCIAQVPWILKSQPKRHKSMLFRLGYGSQMALRCVKPPSTEESVAIPSLKSPPRKSVSQLS